MTAAFSLRLEHFVILKAGHLATRKQPGSHAGTTRPRHGRGGQFLPRNHTIEALPLRVRPNRFPTTLKGVRLLQQKELFPRTHLLRISTPADSEADSDSHPLLKPACLPYHVLFLEKRQICQGGSEWQSRNASRVNHFTPRSSLCVETSS